MSKYRNRKFLSEYIKLDKECAALLKCERGGVSEYINLLSSLGGVDGRDEAHAKLVKYRSYRNKLAHEVGALSGFSEITGEDIKWIKEFLRKVKRRKDPVSRYDKYKRKNSFFHKFKIWTVISLSALFTVGILLLVYFNMKG